MTTTEAEAVDRPKKAADRTGAFVGRTIRGLQEQYVRQPQPTSFARAALAQLRRGLGKEVGQVPELLAFTVDPTASPPRGPAPTRDEIAAHTALTLYALHQQSQSHRMHDPSTTFGSAVGFLRYRDGEENDGVVRRFQALATASDMTEFVQHTRGLITLLRAAERGFDYSRFARDLVRFQEPQGADRVRLAWGRDFFRITEPDKTEETS